MNPTIPLEPTPEMIEAGAQRLASWGDDNLLWPDHWTPAQLFTMRVDAERVWRSMWLVAEKQANLVETQSTDMTSSPP